MEEKLSTIYLRDGRNALQYVMSLSEKYRQIATEAIFECLRLGYPLNNMEITGKARELQRKRNAPRSIQLDGVEIIKKKDKAHFLLFLQFRLQGFEGVDGERGGDNI